MTMLPFAPNVPGIVPGVGYWSRGAITNKCTNFNANPPDLGAVTVSQASGGAGVLSLADDRAELAAAGLMGAERPCTSGLVYKLDNSSGTGSSHASFNGPVGNLNPHTVSAYVRGGSGNLRMGTANVVMSFGAFAAYQRIQGTRTPAATSESAVVSAGAGQIVYFILNQLVEGPQAGPIIVTAGAAASVGADDLRTASPIASDEDFIFWAVVNYRSGPHSTNPDRPAALSDGTTNNRLFLQRSATSGSLSAALVVSGGSILTAPGAGAQTTSGRAVILVRRSAGAGAYQMFSKDSGGTISSASPMTASFPVGINRLDAGSLLGSNHPNSLIEFIGIRKGTFSDAEINAILQAA